MMRFRSGTQRFIALTFEALKIFAKLQGNAFQNVRFWKIQGTIIRDEGGPDGWLIKVSDYKELHPELYPIR